MKNIRIYNSSTEVNSDLTRPRVYFTNDNSETVNYEGGYNTLLYESSGTFTSKTGSSTTVNGKTYLYKYEGMNNLMNFILHHYCNGGYIIKAGQEKYFNKPLKIVINGIEDISIYQYSWVVASGKDNTDSTYKFVGDEFYIYGFAHEFNSGDRCTHTLGFYSNQKFDLNQTITFQVYVS